VSLLQAGRPFGFAQGDTITISLARGEEAKRRLALSPGSAGESWREGETSGGVVGDWIPDQVGDDIEEYGTPSP
jgi:hypothetical protein